MLFYIKNELYCKLITHRIKWLLSFKMVPLGGHALTVVTLVLLRTFLKLFFCNCLQRHFVNHIEEPPRCLLVTNHIPLSLRPLLSSFLSFAFFSAGLALLPTYSGANNLRMPRKGVCWPEIPEQELLVYIEAKCCKRRIPGVQKPFSVGCLPACKCPAWFAEEWGLWLVMSITESRGSPKYT